MGFQRSAWRISATSVGLAAAVILFAAGYRRGVPEVDVVRSRHDSWVLAHSLGGIEGARDVYVPVTGDAGVHYYSLVARRGQPIRIEITPLPNSSRGAFRVRMALRGPGLLPEGGVLLSEPRTENARARFRAQIASEVIPDRAVQVLDARLPQRGRCTLIVQIRGSGRGGYRLHFAGEPNRRLGSLIRFPLRQIEAGWLLWPGRVVGHLLAIATGCVGILGVGRLRRRRRVAAQGGFVG